MQKKITTRGMTPMAIPITHFHFFVPAFFVPAFIVPAFFVPAFFVPAFSDFHWVKGGVPGAISYPYPIFY